MASIFTVVDFSRASQFLNMGAVNSYQLFMEKVRAALAQKKYNEVNELLDCNKMTFSEVIETRKPFDYILEGILEKSDNEAILSALQLIEVLHNHNIFTSFSLFCEAACFLNLGNERDFNFCAQKFSEPDFIELKQLISIFNSLEQQNLCNLLEPVQNKLKEMELLRTSSPQGFEVLNKA
jgi:hypothetical protein